MLIPLVICAGACVGALMRWKLSLWLNPAQGFPLGTLAANGIGAYAAGLALVFFSTNSQLDPAWRLAIFTGLLGALTTFSTFSTETVSMLMAGRWTSALLNTTLNLLGSLLLTWAGVLTMQWWGRT